MGYFVVYCPEDDDADITDGDEVASNSGYAAFLAWAESQGDAYPALAALAQEGAAEPAALEEDLARALREKPGRPASDVLGVAKRLLAAARERPEGTAAVGVTDGTAGGGG
jgi:hypothetical protein